LPRQETVREAKPSQSAEPSTPMAPVPTGAPPSPGAASGWRNALIQKLQQAKRYPEAARERDEQGVATVRFTMDRDGHILSVNLIHGSGSEMLDQEAVAMFRRAEPLPAFPDGSGANTLTLTVPITFSLQ
jgi:protein TonB